MKKSGHTKVVNTGQTLLLCLVRQVDFSDSVNIPPPLPKEVFLTLQALFESIQVAHVNADACVTYPALHKVCR